MKKILEYLPILSICLLYFGFCSLYGFYHEFHIEISSFISTPDIILSFFPTIVIAATTLSGAIFQQLYGDLQYTKPQSENESNLDNLRLRIQIWMKTKGY